MSEPELPILDAQIWDVRDRLVGLAVADDVWPCVASNAFREVSALGEVGQNRVRAGIPIAPEKYLEEMSAFQSWMDIANAHQDSPVMVRAQIMSQLYVGFVWLRDSLMKPIADAVPDGAIGATASYLSTGERRRLRNAVAHGRWQYRDDFSGLDCWDGRPPSHFVVSSGAFGAWQLLSRGIATAALLALAS